MVKGRININSKPQERYLSASWPLYTSGNIFKSFLSAQGVNIKGRVKIATVVKNKKFIFSHKSEPLGSLVKYINVYSNNFMTHVLTCQLGVELLDQEKESKQNPHKQKITTTKTNNYKNKQNKYKKTEKKHTRKNTNKYKQQYNNNKTSVTHK